MYLTSTTALERYLDEDPASYHIVGDIKKLNVHVCCAVTTDDQSAGIFTATPEQYTSAFADVKRAAAEESAGRGSGSVPAKALAKKTCFPVVGYFVLDSSHLSNAKKKPIPYSGRYCGFSGYLTGMSSALEGQKMIDRFRVEVHTVAFMGSVTAPKATPIHSDYPSFCLPLFTNFFSHSQMLLKARRQRPGPVAATGASPVEASVARLITEAQPWCKF
ncbi:hypothetical protein K438DRAFT_1770296 [Mycena galopus ATCC 62051]|nr:hypothetical protein K438DRAFT_1770296 [Mycena galopus ATCC 62051]